jgi:TP901 family phage tail tape measure protein
MPGQVVGTAILELLGDSAQFRAELKRAASRFEEVGRRMEAAGRTLTAAVTLPIVAIGVAAGKAAIDFESSFAGIRKTMDLTEAEFKQLAQANRDLAKAIPVSVNELNRIGELAGQLGIRGVDNVLKFEDTIARLAVTTDLTADQAALAFAQIANVIQLPQDQVDRLGATVVGLGNNFATTESRIVDFTQRIAGAAKIAGVTTGATAGIATAFASMGVEAEAGGTAVQKVLLAMVSAVESGGDELAAFAGTAGLTAAEFAASFRRDAAGAFASFVEGLGRQGNAAIGTLERLGLQDQRLIRAFLAAAGAGDLVTRAIAQGNREFELNTALVEESAKRFDTAASKLRVFWNQLVDISITLGDAFVPILIDALDALQPVVEAAAAVAEAFSRLPRPIRLVTVAIVGMVAALAPALIAFGLLSKSIGLASSAFGILVGGQLAQFTIATARALFTVQSFGAGFAVLRSALTLFGGALLGPAGIVAGITAVVGVFALWRRATADQRAEQDALNTVLGTTTGLLDEQRIAGIRAIEARIAALTTEAERLRALSARYKEGSRINEEFAEQASDAELAVFQLRTRLEELLHPVEALSRVPPIDSAFGNVDLPEIVNEDVTSAIDELRASLRSAAILSDVLGDSFNRGEAEAGAYRQAVEALVDAGLQAADATGFQSLTLQQLADRYAEVQARVDAAAATQREHAEAMRDAQRALTQQAAAIDAIVNPLRRQNEQVALAVSLWSLGIISLERLSEVMAEAYGSAAGKVKQSTERISAGTDLLFSSLANLASSFASFAADGRQSFGQFAEAVIRDIARMIAQFLALKAIAGILTAISPALGGSFASFVGIGKRAHGGPVAVNRPYLVGERGPELFVPQSAGTVMASGAGGGTLRMDTSSLPPRPSIVTPDAVATDDWWRRAFSHLKVDYDDRGGL